MNVLGTENAVKSEETVKKSKAERGRGEEQSKRRADEARWNQS